MDISRFSNARVLVVGDVMLDRYWWGSVDRISPEAPVPIVRLNKTSAAPGGAANVAVNVAALGGMPFLIGCCGDDVECDQLKDSLNASGVTTEGLLTVASRRTTVKTRIVAHHQQVVRIDQEDARPIGEEESDSVRELIAKYLTESDLVIISDYAKGTLSDGVLSYLIEKSHVAKKAVLVDPKGKHFAKYAGATILTPNRREAAEACSLDETADDLVNLAGEKLIRLGQFENVLITEGEHGMTLFEKDGVFHIDAAAHQVFDVTGAGDTVIATLGIAMAAGFDLRSAVLLANTAAGISVGRIGANAVTVDLLAKEMRRQAVTASKG
ncbi:MAG: D-glycero-beta-D-manno-heptose-7-phosphate kinase [Pyrinomonadaceae bacterium]